jgi:hypothetical protein
MKATTARNTKPAQTGAAMNRFFTLEKANKGKVLDLLLPDGEKSGYSLTVVNRLSDVATRKRRRKMKLTAPRCVKGLPRFLPSVLLDGRCRKSLRLTT